ncbi:TPA: 4Fe-4S binding protein, partial [Escherichia coli]
MNRFIIADATKCIGCRTCEVACAVSHQENQDCAALSPDEFISRIRVIKDHSWTTAVACHQCEDAPCANVCPVNAISREHGHIFVEQTRCIGCKSCMLACPFGAMEVVSSRKKARAIKCDLCWH